MKDRPALASTGNPSCVPGSSGPGVPRARFTEAPTRSLSSSHVLKEGVDHCRRQHVQHSPGPRACSNAGPATEDGEGREESRNLSEKVRLTQESVTRFRFSRAPHLRRPLLNPSSGEHLKRARRAAGRTTLASGHRLTLTETDLTFSASRTWVSYLHLKCHSVYQLNGF